MGTEMTMQQALTLVVENLNRVEVKGRTNISLILNSQDLLESCLKAMQKVAKQPEIEIRDAKMMTEEEIKAVGAEPIC